MESSPIDRLSDAILMRVFRFVSADAPAILPYVCTGWRAVAVQEPTLWTKICIHLTTDNISKNIEKVNWCIEHSAQLPLDIVITGELRRDHPAACFAERPSTTDACPTVRCMPIIRALVGPQGRNTARWRSLEFNSQYVRHENYILQHLLGTRIPLAPLTMVATRPGEVDESVRAEDILLSEEVQREPRNFHLLEKFSFHGRHTRGNYLQGMLPVHAPNLHSLWVPSIPGNVVDADRLPVYPNLQHLTVSSPSPELVHKWKPSKLTLRDDWSWSASTVLEGVVQLEITGLNTRGRGSMTLPSFPRLRELILPIESSLTLRVLLENHVQWPSSLKAFTLYEPEIQQPSDPTYFAVLKRFLRTLGPQLESMNVPGGFKQPLFELIREGVFPELKTCHVDAQAVEGFEKPDRSWM